MYRRVVGITGMPGARKTDVASIFASELGIPVLSMSALIHDEIVRAGLAPTPAAYRDVGLRLRAEHGPQVLAERALSRLPDALPFSVLDGLRTRAEVDYLQANTGFFRLVCVHASRQDRFARMRARSGPELQAWEDLAEQDEQNLKLGLGDVMAIADYVIPNGSYAEPFEQLARHICHLLAQQCAAESI